MFLMSEVPLYDLTPEGGMRCAARRAAGILLIITCRGASLIKNTPLLGPYSSPTVVLGEGAVSCERGTPVATVRSDAGGGNEMRSLGSA